MSCPPTPSCPPVKPVCPEPPKPSKPPCKLEGKVALVTGAADGLGKAFCKALLCEGARVFMCDIDADKGQRTADEFKKSFGNCVEFLRTDVTVHEQMLAAFQGAKKAFNNLDIVVNNAGISGEVAPIWPKVIDVNLKGTITGTMLGIETMRRDKGGNGGVIINVSSMMGIRPNPFGPVYAATKSGIIGYSKSYAANPQLKNFCVRINVLCPSVAKTNLAQNLNEQNCLDVEGARAWMQQFGFLEPEQVAEALVQLVTDECKNGAVMTIVKREGIKFV